MTPKVSVIVPNYNHAPYLKQRIDSILNQSFQDFELILLDDCSTDNSCEILDTYKNHHKVSHCIYNTNNSGSTFIQWEKGIQLARGEYIWIAESDDWADNEFLEKTIPVLENNVNAGLVFTSSFLVDASGELTYRNEFQNTGNVIYYKGHQFNRQKLATTNTIWNASMVVFRKKDFPLDILKQAKKYKFCGDWLIYSQIALKTDVVEIMQTLNYYRIHPKNVSTNAEKSGLAFTEGLQVYNSIKHIFTLFERIKFNFKWGKQFIKFVEKHQPESINFNTIKSFILKDNRTIMSAFYFYKLKNHLKLKLAS